MEVLYPSFLSFTVTRTNATRDPSGDTCGSPIQTKSQRSFSVILRFWAKAGARLATKTSKQIINERIGFSLSNDEARMTNDEAQISRSDSRLAFGFRHSFDIRHLDFVILVHLLNHVVAKLGASAFARLRRDFTRWQNSHVGNNVAAKLATLDLGRAFHQAREIVGDALARDGAV